MDIKNESAFFGKQKELEYVQELHDHNHAIPHEKIMYKHLAKVISKAAKANKKLDRLDSALPITLIQTERNISDYGIYYDEYMIQYGLLPCLVDDSVDINYDFKYITLELSLVFLNLNNIISKRING